MNVFRKFRKKHNLTQEELADKIDATQGAISHYENDRRTPELPHAKAFIKFAKRKGEKYSLDDVYA